MVSVVSDNFSTIGLVPNVHRVGIFMKCVRFNWGKYLNLVLAICKWLGKNLIFGVSYKWIVCSVLLLGLKFGLLIWNFSSNVMFDTILSGCDGIRQHPSNDVMWWRYPIRRIHRAYRLYIQFLLRVQDGAGGPAPRDGKPVPDDLAWLSTPK